jgi:hypothetical protein
MNHKLILTFILAFIFSLHFVTAASNETVSTVLPVKQIVPELVVVKKTGKNKLTVEVKWDGTGEAEDGIYTSNIFTLWVHYK